MIILIFGLLIGICYWALWQPQIAFRRRGWRHLALWLVTLAYLGLAKLDTAAEKPFFAPMFIVYALFYSVLFREFVLDIVGRVIRSRVGRYFVILLLLWFSEIFAAMDIMNREPIDRHMLMYIGFYAGLALVVVYFLSRWRYTFPALFTLGGLWGILVERQFAGLQMLVFGDILGFLTFASLIFPVYGFYLAGPYFLLYEEISPNPRTSRWQYILLFIAVAVVPLVTWALWIALLKLLGADTTVYVV